MEELDVGQLEGKAELDEPMGRRREIGGYEQAAEASLAWRRTTSTGTLTCAQHALYRPAHEEQPETADWRGAPDQKVGISRLGKDVADGDGILVG